MLSTFDLNSRQRGFIAASGCSENSFLLSEMIEHAKKNHESLCVTFLDLATAFDTVSQTHRRGAKAVPGLGAIRGDD